jgi:ATP-dependent protease ClpP protease subunit
MTPLLAAIARSRARLATPVAFDPAEPRDPDGKWGHGAGHVVEKLLKMANGDVDSHVDSDGLHLQYGDSTSGGLDHDAAWNLADLLDGGHEGKFPRTNSVATGPADGAPTGFAQVTQLSPHEYRLELLNNDTTFDLSGVEAKQLANVVKKQAGASRVDTGHGQLDVFVTDDNHIGLRTAGPDGKPVDLHFDEHSWNRLRDALDVVLDGSDDGGDFGYDPSEKLDELRFGTNVGELLVHRVGDGKDAVLEIGPADHDTWKIVFPYSADAVWGAFDAAEQVAGFRNYTNQAQMPARPDRGGLRRAALFGGGMRVPAGARRLILNRAAPLLDGNQTATPSRGTRPRAHRGERDERWYRIRNAASPTSAEVYIYDEIGFWGVSAQDFVNELKAITAPAIELHINSPGGEVWDGIAIYNAIKNHKADVTVRIDGIAASAASFIAQAGNKVIIERNAEMMIHDALSVCFGNAADMLATAELLDKGSNNIADIYAQRAGGTVASWREKMRAETWYSAAEAVAAGLADEVGSPSTKPAAGDAEVSNTWDLSVFRYPGREKAPAPVAALAAGDVTGPDGDRGQDPAPAGPDAVDPPPALPDPIEPVDAPADDSAPVDAPAQVDVADAFDGVRDAVTEPPTVPAPFDVDTFRAALAVVAQDAPAPTPADPAPPAVPEPELVDEPPAVDVQPAVVLPIDPATIRTAARAAVAPPTVDPDLFRAAIRVVANDAPAPPAAPAPTPPGDGNPTEIDPIAFRRALREARL